MLNLIKYEFVKKYKLILIVLISSLTLNLLALTQGSGGSLIFLSFFPMAMSVLYLVDIIKMYSDDLNRKTGYMLFMTPNSGYKIITSKIITAVIEGLFILLLYFIFLLLNGIYIIYETGAVINYTEVIYAMNNFLSGSFGFNLGHVFAFLLSALLLAIGFLTTVYTAMTIRKSIFSEIKFGGALSFMIFILLNWGGSFISSEILNLFSPLYSSFTGQPSATELLYMFIPINILSIAQSIIFIICSGYLLENKINL